MTLREIQMIEDTIIEMEQKIASLNGEIDWDSRSLASKKYARKLLKREARELRIKWDDACSELFGQIRKDRGK